MTQTIKRYKQRRKFDRSSILGEAVYCPIVPVTISDEPYSLVDQRAYQAEIVLDHLSRHRHTLTVSPTGSGKSVIIMADVARHNKSVIIATPKLSINDGFVRLTKTTNFVAKLSNGKICRLRCNKVETPGDNKAAEMQRLLKGAGRSIIVCSHASLTNFMERCTANTKKLLKDTVVYLDEVHHSDIDGENTLGKTVDQCLKLCYGIHAFTATPFRTNGANILNGEFKQWRRTLKVHYVAGCCPDFGMHVRFFDKVKPSEYDFESERHNSQKLIDAYLEEYCKHSKHPTLMIVDGRKEAYELNDPCFCFVKSRICLNIHVSLFEIVTNMRIAARD